MKLKLHVNKILFRLIFSIIILTESTSVLSYESCSSLFHIKKDLEKVDQNIKKFSIPELLNYENNLDPDKLKKYNFLIGDQGELWDTSGSKIILLGKLKIIKTDRLFQWANKSYQNEILKRNGINSKWMNSILSAEKQVAGVGFYVSTHPYDSGDYGNSLTVFEIKKPIVLFELYDRVPSENTIDNTEFAKRAKLAGIDGFRTEIYFNTWMSLINEEFLNKPRSVNASEITPFIEYGLANKTNYLLFLRRTIKKNYSLIEDKYNANLISKLLSNQDLSSEEIFEALKFFNILSKSKKEKIISLIRKDIQNAKTQNDLSDILRKIYVNCNNQSMYYKELLALLKMKSLIINKI